MLEKLLSGRFILTLIVGCVFAYCSCTGMLGVDKVMEVILLVIYGYFTKNRSQPNPPKNN